MFRPPAPLAAVLSLALPQVCAVCRAVDVGLCASCRAEVRETLWEAGPRRSRPSPEPAGLPPVHTTGRFEGALAGLVTAYKDDGRRDVSTTLGPLLGAAVEAALVEGALVEALVDGTTARRQLVTGGAPVLVVPVPSSAASRRRRGDAPLVVLARRAVHGFSPGEVVVADVLRVGRRVADQAGLDAAGRHANVEHSMVVRRAWARALRGATCVLVDDVLTTGATLVEAARVLRSGGAGTVAAAAICATQRRWRGRSQAVSESAGSSR